VLTLLLPISLRTANKMLAQPVACMEMRLTAQGKRRYSDAMMTQANNVTNPTAQAAFAQGAVV